MAISCFFQFLDKAALGYTAILGLNNDLKLSGQDFSWASAIYYIGYLVASYPAGWLIVRYPVAKVIAASMSVAYMCPLLNISLLLQTSLGRCAYAYRNMFQFEHSVSD